MKTTLAAFLCLLCSSSALADYGGATLMLWPTARSVALGGAMTALADEPDAEFWNPGGLGLQPGASFAASARRWLDLRDLRYLGGDWTFSRVAGADIDVNAGIDFRYSQDTPMEAINEMGRLIGTYRPWDAATGVHGGVGIGRHLGVGLALKYYHALHVPGWVLDSIGFGRNHEALTSVGHAADAGVLYRPLKQLAVGLGLSNLGWVRYSWLTEVDKLPTTARLGLCGTPVDIPLVRARLLGEASLILTEESTAFADAGGRLWKTAAAEVTVLQLVSGRISYLWTRDYAMWQGWRWGIGVGYKDYVRLDVTRDRPYFSTNRSEWVLGLAANNIIGLADELKQGIGFDW